MNHDEIFEKAVSLGCQPFWWNGIFGPGWHCGCEDLAHASDQQCSAISLYKLLDIPVLLPYDA